MGSDIPSATAHDIRDIAEICPELLQLEIDIPLHFSRANIAILPNEILEALAQFKKAINLELHFHVANSGLADFVLTHLIYYEIFNIILDERERLQLPCHSSFEVGLIIVREWEKMNFEQPDYRLTLSDTGKVIFEDVAGRRSLDLRRSKTAIVREAFKLRCSMHRALHSKSGVCEDFDGRGFT